jgi:dihydroflavonol-4-reductase
MRVLVTGATGFLGSHLARQLAERGNDVRVLVRSSSDRSRLDGVDLDYAVGDVTDRASVERALEGIDLVFHCAAVVEFGPRDPSFMESINVGGTENVLGAAFERGIPSVYVSSLSATGATPPGEEPKDESWWNPAEPAAVYEDHKRRAHLFARSLIEQGAAIRIAMPGGIYGYGDQSTMFDLIKTYVQYTVPIGYLPEVRQSTVNVDDCADALIRIAEQGKDGEEYVVVAEAVSMKDWLDLICIGAGRRPPAIYLPTRVVRALGVPGTRVAGWLGQSPTMVAETVAVATHDCAYRGDKLRRELGWSPRPLDEGMAEMAAAIQADLVAERAVKRAERAAARAKRV